MSETFRPRAYLLEGCPFSFKFLLYITEAGLRDRLDIVRVKSDTPQLDEVKDKLSKGLGKRATFPTVEIEPDRYLSDSDKLIQHFAKLSEVQPNSPTMNFYVETILPQVVKLHEMQHKK